MAKLTDTTNKMREVMMSRGNYEGERMRLLAKIFVFLTMVFILATMMEIFKMENNQIKEKIFLFKNINMLICGLVFPLVDKDTYRLITLIDDRDQPNLGIKLSEAQTSFQTKIDSELDEVYNYTYLVTIVTFSIWTFGPILATISTIFSQILSNSEVHITSADLSLPIKIWYPEQFANTSTFFVLYALQTFYIYLYAGYMYCTVGAGLMALKKAINEMRVLCLIVKDWDDEKLMIDEGEMEEAQSFNMEKNYYNVPNVREGLINVIKLHDSICRKVNILNSALERMYTVFNDAICFQICICLYSSAKMEDIVLKVNHLLLIIPMASITFLYCSIAQSLLNEGENFRTTLGGSSFVDKPKWFRTSLLLIMTRTSKELEIKPYGCYVLNLKMFSTVLNAAYSYFNMLNSLQKRI